MSKRKFVYFAVSDDQSTVKIGSSINPRVRIRQVRWHSRNRISLLFQFPGDYRLEYGIHAYFGADHIGHEWFRYTDNIRAFVESAMQHGVSTSARARFRRLFQTGKWRELNAARYTQASISLQKRHASDRRRINRGK